ADASDGRAPRADDLVEEARRRGGQELRPAVDGERARGNVRRAFPNRGNEPRQQGEAEDRPIDPARPREAEGRGEKHQALHVLRVVRGEPRGERTAEGEADEVNRAARLAAQGEEGL